MTTAAAGSVTLALSTISVSAGSVVTAGSLVVASGTTMTVGSDVSFVLQAAQTFTDDGMVDFNSGDTVSLVRSSSGSGDQIVVNGSLTASATSFIDSGGSSSFPNVMQVDSGGHANILGGSFALDSMALLSGAAANMSVVVYSGQLAINSAATVAISGNDFSNVPAAGVIASGDPSADIPLTDNYWGSTNTTQIAAKIKDHVTDATLPTITFVPFAGARSSINANDVITTYDTAAHAINLGAAVSSPSGAVGEGTVTFTVFNNTSQQIGSAVSGAVVDGLCKCVLQRSSRHRRRLVSYPSRLHRRFRQLLALRRVNRRQPHPGH